MRLICRTPPLSSRGERMRASGLLERPVRRPVTADPPGSGQYRAAAGTVGSSVGFIQSEAYLLADGSLLHFGPTLRQ
jgi:hypothetical protein